MIRYFWKCNKCGFETTTPYMSVGVSVTFNDDMQDSAQIWHDHCGGQTAGAELEPTNEKIICPVREPGSPETVPLKDASSQQGTDNPPLIPGRAGRCEEGEG